MAKTTCASIVLSALGGFLLASPAYATGTGACSLNAKSASGTYGFAGEGAATANTQFAPAGAVVQSGTVTQAVTSVSGQTLSGTWSVTLTQNDSSGYHANVQFGGHFQANASTCQGDFYVDAPVKLTNPAFHVVFVDDGDGLRTVSLIPDLFLDYPTARKL